MGELIMLPMHTSHWPHKQRRPERAEWLYLGYLALWALTFMAFGATVMLAITVPAGWVRIGNVSLTEAHAVMPPCTFDRFEWDPATQEFDCLGSGGEIRVHVDPSRQAAVELDCITIETLVPTGWNCAEGH